MQFKAFTIVTMAIVCSSLIGCGSSSEMESSLDSPETGGIRSIAVQLNWYPEAEHGGVYQAEVEGIYRDAGLKVDIRPGGRATPVAPELELERVQFAFANADDVVIYRRQGLDVVAIAATMQNSPRCILVQEASTVKTFDDLKGVIEVVLVANALSPFHALQRRHFGEKLMKQPGFEQQLEPTRRLG